MDKTDVALSGKAKPRWPLWKKLAIFGTALIVIVALAVGLGVGLTRSKGGSDSDDDSSNSSSGGGDTSSDQDSVGHSNSTTPALNGTALWHPKPNTTWQIILSHGVVPSAVPSIAPNVAVYDLDLYDNNATTFAALQDQGIKVICYFSAGSWEDWRSDKDDFAKADLGKTLDGWPNEKWLNISSPGVRDIMKQRIKLASDKGCNAIDPDNVDGYQNDNGLDLTTADSVSFMKFLSKEAAALNMTTGLKNAGDIIEDVLPYVSFSVNEQCIEYSECDTFAAFIDAGKPVFNIEYPKSAPKITDATREVYCSGKGKAAHTKGFSTVIKKMILDGWVEYCDGKTYETPIKGS
ncbi:hypothetical protein G7046_g8717 [Stylonectria norvegica]|nr:hypothetical protein G7046_g8717 [Stylonectria norvegica]